MPVKLPFGSLFQEAEEVQGVGFFGRKRKPPNAGRSYKAKPKTEQHKYPRDRFHDSFFGKVDSQTRDFDTGYQRRRRALSRAWDDYTGKLWGARSQEEKHAQLSSRQAHGFYDYLIEHADEYGLHPEEVRQAENNMFGMNSKMRPKRGPANDNE